MDELEFAELEADVKAAISYLNKAEDLLGKVLRRVEKVELVKH